MSDPDRLAHLVTELSAHRGYATGSRRFPELLDDDDGAAVAEALSEEMDGGTAMRAELAARQGHRIACGPGCSACCEIMVMIYRPEAVRIARWLGRPENAGARAAFLAAYGPWRAAVGDAPERLTELFVGGEAAAYDELHMAHWRRRVLCAFNREGRCSIYEVRPLACRNAHALETADRCRADSARPAEAVSFVPLDEFVHNATRLLRAAHNASGARPAVQRHGLRAISAAVYDLLADPVEETDPTG